MSITSYFGMKIRAKRESLGLSQERLADLSGLHRTYIGSVERGERNITLLSAEKIAQSLGSTLSVILSEKEDCENK